MEKKIYKSVLKIEILSEEPIEDGYSLNDISYQITDGDWSGDTDRENRNIELQGKEAAEACINQGTSPEFFMMDDEGNEMDGI